MIWAILFYCLIIFITLYLWWVISFRSYYTKDISFRSYYTKDNRSLEDTWNKGDKVKFPLWQLIVTFSLAFVPGINILLLMSQVFLISDLTNMKDVEFRSFLFKKY